MVKKVAFCIGNGQSRKGFDLEKLRDIGPLYGCGAVWRDNHVDNLICCDKFKAREAAEHHVEMRSNFYTRAEYIPHLEAVGIKPLPSLPYFGLEPHEQPSGWDSGLYAVHTAIHEEADVVMLLGYDFYGWGKNQSRVNNIYKRTKHYNKEKKPRDPITWIKQFQLLFKTHYTITFIFIKPSDYPHPPEFDSWRYVLFDTYEGLDKFANKKLDDIHG